MLHCFLDCNFKYLETYFEYRGHLKTLKVSTFQIVFAKLKKFENQIMNSNI
jgi:hypothetical protein